MVREFSGSDLDFVSEAEGSTWIISEVTVKVMDQHMPHMIGDVVLLITQPMIDYRQEKS